MSPFIDAWVSPLLRTLFLWSLQWGVLIAALMVGVRTKPLRSIEARLYAGRFVLAAGLLLPFVPRHWGPTIEWPRILGDQGLPSLPVAAHQPATAAAESPSPVKPQASETTPLAKKTRERIHVATSVKVIESGTASTSLPQFPPASERFGWARIAIGLAAAAWLVGVVVQTLRLIAGWASLARIVGRSHAASPVQVAEFDRCQRQLGLKCAVTLRIHPAVRVPLLIGGSRPVVLVPEDWQRFSATSRCAILLHELAHAQHYDDISKFVEEAVRCIFFFHPLVYWLMGRIDADREELCDAAAIRQGMAPRDVAEALLEATRLAGFTRRIEPLCGPALWFFRLPSARDRIERLIEEEGTSRWSARPSRYSVAGTFLVVAALFAAVGSFGLKAAEAPRPEMKEGPAPAAKKQTPMPKAAPTQTQANTADLSNQISEQLSHLISEQQARDFQAGKPVEMKKLGKVTLNELVLAVLAGRPEGPRGRLVDVAGRPIIAGDKPSILGRVTPLCRGAGCILQGQSSLADGQGRFVALPAPDGHEKGRLTSVQVQLADGQVFESSYDMVENGIVDVHLPTHLHPKAAPPMDVGPDDLAGLVVDPAGGPLEGVEVVLSEGADADSRRVTDKHGRFRFANCGAEFSSGQVKSAVVRFRKAGYCPQRFFNQPLGVKGWVVALNSETFLEGTVRGPDGKLAPNALIRANEGPKQNVNGVFPDIWTEATTDRLGRFRLYVQPDEYELSIKCPGVGVARLSRQPILFGQKKRLDVSLAEGVMFQATIVDSQTNKPVPNVRLWHWQHPGVEGRSDAQGKLAIAEMFPGDFSFSVEAQGFARWWSNEAKSPWSRKTIDNKQLKWQRNFDEVDFELRAGMKPATIVVEREVRVRGRVVDPAGHPVKGATVAPALTGTDNSLTGDTRFSVETKADGTFDLSMPASHQAKYNLIAHDGKFEEWRKWANAVLPPIETRPAQDIENVELRLNRPGTIRGRLVDEKGAPVANCALAANATDKLDNRYYAPPTVTTDAAGRFELRYLQPGEYEIGATWLLAPDGLGHRQWETRKHAPLTLREGQELSGVELRAKKLSQK